MPKKSHALALLAAALVSLGAGAAESTAPRGTLKPFASEKELAALFDRWAEEQRSRRDGSRAYGAMKSQAAPASLAAAEADSITNVQHAGVDEGGIVKVHGDHLVVLRRGRLFTVSLRDSKARSVIDAFGPDVDPRGAWYDEMLISGDTIAVIGYSYARGGTEIGLFRVSRSGELAYKATYHLRSNDYYSSRNYASRLIGSKLVFYSPLYLNPWGGNPYDALPAMRQWGKGEFRRIAPATRIYRSDEPLEPSRGLALHTVSVCDLAKAEMECESTSVLGPAGRVFYVSPDAVFVWNVKSAVFRIPLDGSAPSALKVAGSPIDQFSFLQDGEGFLNVLVRAGGQGEAMWSSEARAGDFSLLRVHLSRFSDGREAAPADAYQALPSAPGWQVQNRFVGSYLLYGSSALYAVRYADGTSFGLPLRHRVDRLEALGGDAVVIGSAGRDLHFTSLRLAPYPVKAGSYVQQNAAQGETRSHGFFYRSEDGLLGLPIIGGGGRAMRHQLRHTSASVLFLKNTSLEFTEVGTLDARPASVDDGCRASCVDWYGNSRPLFIRGRVFALMGYELVEGRVADGRIIEVGRVDYARELISWRIGLR